MNATFSTTERPYELSRNDNVCVAAFSQLVGCFIGGGASIRETARNLRRMMKETNLRFYVDEGIPADSSFETIPEEVWKNVVDWTNDDDSNDVPVDSAIPRILCEGNLPTETIKETMRRIRNPTESILGIYDLAKKRIVLFSTTIKLSARCKRIKDTVLNHVVLIHEIGHWFHELVVGDDPVSGYSNSSTELKECIAQWFAACLFSFAKHIPPRDRFRPSGASNAFIREYECAFSKLNAGQVPPYTTFAKFSGCSPHEFVAAIAGLRSRKGNTTLADLEAILPVSTP